MAWANQFTNELELEIFSLSDWAWLCETQYPKLQWLEMEPIVLSCYKKPRRDPDLVQRLKTIMSNRHICMSLSLYLTICHKVVSVSTYIMPIVYVGRMERGKKKSKWLFSLFKSFSRIPHNKFPFHFIGQNCIPRSLLPCTTKPQLTIYSIVKKWKPVL